MYYVFGDCVLDTQRYVLHRAGQPIRLRPKVFQVLVYLLSQRERVVPKQELGDRVWHGQAISDATLESTLAAVRRALGDRGRDHRYIQTMHGYGYRFVAAVATTLPSVGEHAPGSPLGEEAGAPLASQETPPLDREPSSEAGERKLVSVLCCALSLAPGPREPEDLDTLHQHVRALSNLSQREAQRYGGTVQPVAGERVLAVFGLPATQEDYAQRAVLAALSLQQRLQQVPTTGERTPTPWPLVGMAVHTGPVAVGGLNHEAAAATAVVGETVTQAIAFQEASAPGVILCSAATARLVRELVRFEAIAPETPPGLSTPMYQIVGFRQRRMPGGRRAGQRLSPFVGR